MLCERYGWDIHALSARGGHVSRATAASQEAQQHQGPRAVRCGRAQAPFLFMIVRVSHEESAAASAERRMGTRRPVPRGRIAPGERRAEIIQGSSFLSVYDSSFGGHQ